MAQLYAKLIAAGSASPAAGVEVGAEVEEMDIQDLQKALAQATQDDVRAVYENLLRASRNHLRAFSKMLQSTGAAYQAKHLNQDEFNRIAQSGVERGGGAMQGAGNRRGRGGAMQGARGGQGRGAMQGSGGGRRAGQGRGAGRRGSGR